MFMAEAPPTIHDVARKLNVSSTTVWRALNNSPRVSSKTRQRVLRAAKKMNYRPSLVAQTLLRGRTQTLGVVVPMIGNPVYASLVRGVEQLAFQHEYNIILCDTDFRLDRESDYIDMLVRRRVEGIAVIPFAARALAERDYAHLTSLPKQGVAVVCMQQEIPHDGIDAVLPDNRGAGRAMTADLIRLGHRRIGFIHGGMPAWNIPMRERYEGYRLALADAGIQLDETLVFQAGSFESVLTDDPGHFRADELASFLSRPDRPTALFAPVDVLAIQVMEVVRDRMGLRVPEDISVAGFDDILMSAHTSPPLTTVRQPARQVGRRSAELLFERLAARGASPGDGGTNGAALQPRIHERIPCELIIRRSCGAAPTSHTA